MKILKRLAHVLSGFPMKSIFIMIIIVVLLAMGVKDIFMATGNDTLVEPDSEVYLENLMLEKEFGGESIIVLYESENLLTPAHLEHMKGIEDALQNNESIYSILSPVTLTEEMVESQTDTLKKGFSMEPGLPDNQETLDNMIYGENNELRPMFKELVIDDRYMIMMIKLNGETDDSGKTKVIDTINNYLVAEEIDTAETMVSGKPVLDNATRTSMQESIQAMMGLALVIMIIVLSILFKVRWRILPLVIVLLAVIGTVGLMGWLQIPITMVSMAVFPILIGLGIDYAIQFQNRYAEEMAKEDSNE
ncbi:MMPL family transporter [Planococcus sp. ISL-110]|uniref:MMPL family transporter n=1 Tax=Planococcus sp. ISL-110 TaxID=2819167 RepID=UPI001BE898EA|nr:MMPL family transporter [Planococcus sp. ISL-110]MBT2572065.1 MMPL family transporter [Planococcus sp. ISL-110]